MQETREGPEGWLVPPGLGSSAFPGDNPADRSSGLEGLGGTAHFASRTPCSPHVWCTEHPGEQEERDRGLLLLFSKQPVCYLLVCEEW